MTVGDSESVVELIRRDRQHVSTWGGGTTTEIAIYPKGAIYGCRDFRWRISSARVESEFTILPGIWRLIMVLEGDMTLEHERHHSARLQPFQQDAFAGEWVTRSRGMAMDFNIMLTAGCTGQIRAVSMQRGSNLAVRTETVRTGDPSGRVLLVVYSVDGEVTAEAVRDEIWTVGVGDALLLTSGHTGVVRSVQLSNPSDALTHLVLATIHY